MIQKMNKKQLCKQQSLLQSMILESGVISEPLHDYH